MTSYSSTKRNSQGRTLTPAQQLTSYFDRDCQFSRSTHRSKNRDYDVVHSWDARSDNGENDHTLKVEQKEVATQHTRPICLLGSQVILMEKNSDGLAGICVNQEEKTIASLPLTVEQETIGMKPSLDRISIPLSENAVKENKKIIETVPLTFEKMQLVPPTFTSVKEPSYFKECGPQLDQKLLTPAQRREILEFEKKKFAADSYMRQAVSDRSKLKKNLVGVDFKRGVVGYDNGTNPESEIYGEKAKQYIEAKNQRQIIADSRRDYLGEKKSNMGHSGNILNPDLMSSNVKTEKFYQNKGGKIHALTFQETYYRVLESNKEIRKNSLERTQQLRDQDLSGKNYNIVTHTAIEHWPSKVNTKEDKRLLHPSQASLDGPRNLQGSMRPF